MIAALQGVLRDIDCSETKDPGRVTIRRLNRTEYRNTIRDLVGVRFDPTKGFPSDGDGGGGSFDNNADGLFLPPILMEKYLDAATMILDKAIITPPIQKRIDPEKLPAHLAQGKARKDHTFLNSTGRISWNFHFPKTGVYTFEIRAWGERRGPTPPKIELRLGKTLVRSTPVYAPAKKPGVYKFRRRVNKGSYRLTLNFTNGTKEKLPSLSVDYIKIIGTPAPINAQAKVSHKAIFTAAPAATVPARKAAENVIANFARRAFRRPVTPTELKNLMSLYDRAAQRGDPFELAVKLALKRILISPFFLFRIEADQPAKTAYRISDYELASRLSYFLWSSMPDQVLFDLAASKKLSNPEIMAQQVKRMLADLRSIAIARNFGGQWLGYRSLGITRRPDPKRFPMFTLKLRDAMKMESTLFVHHVLTKNRPILEFIDADYTFLNKTLASHYQITNVNSETFERVSLPNRSRGGILGMASILTLTSYPLRTSPVLRGKWVLEELLGTPPPPPPADAGDLPPDDRQMDGLTFRRRLEQHRKDAKCASCHNRMDPLGFGLENFDAIGRWRNEQAGKIIDTSGVLPNGERFSGPQELKKILLKQKETFARNLAEKLLSYALGRQLEYYDECAIREIIKGLKKDQYRSTSLILAIARSYPFGYRRNHRPEDED